MTIQKLQNHFKNYGYEYSYEYFNNEHFLDEHKAKYTIMVAVGLSPDLVDDWIELERIFGVTYCHREAEAISNTLHEKYNINISNLEDILKNKCR